MLRTTVALFALITPASLAAQQPGLVGTWKINYASGVRMENGEQTITRANGTLTVARQGDSLIANLTPEGGTRPPLRLATRSADPAVFESHSQATVNLNGEASTVTSTNVWTLRAVGDSLAGTIQRSIGGPYPQQMDPQPVSGRRVGR
jgi:hypothetical protein